MTTTTTTRNARRPGTDEAVSLLLRQPAYLQATPFHYPFRTSLNVDGLRVINFVLVQLFYLYFFHPSSIITRLKGGSVSHHVWRGSKRQKGRCISAIILEEDEGTLGEIRCRTLQMDASIAVLTYRYIICNNMTNVIWKERRGADPLVVRPNTR